MSSQSKKCLNHAISAFAADVRAVSQRWEDGVASLKRAVDLGVSSGPHEFKHALADVEEDVNAVARQLEDLEQHTSQAISLLELLGHCTSLYQSNRQGLVHLEAHLKQYGYKPAGPLQHPAEPLAAQNSSAYAYGSDDDLGAASDGSDARADTARGVDQAHCGVRTGARQGRVVTASTPHYEMSKEARARLKERAKTPGIGLRAALRAGQSAFDSDEDDDCDSDIDTHAHTTGRDTAAAPAQQHPSTYTHTTATVGKQYATGTNQQQGQGQYGGAYLAATAGRATGGGVGGGGVGGRARAASPPSGSDTPDVMLLSESFAALQAKYGGGGGGDTGDNNGANTNNTNKNDTDNILSGLTGLTPTALPNDRANDAGNRARGGIGVGVVGMGGGYDDLGVSPARGFTTNAGANVRGGVSNGARGGGAYDEDTTCALYAQLIRSKDMPSSLMHAAPAPAPPRANTAAGAGVGGVRASYAADMAVVRGVVAAAAPAAAGGAAAGTPPRAGAGASPYRAMSAPRSGAKERLHAAQSLQSQLNDLEVQWELTGQAELTPRRAAYAAGTASVGWRGSPHDLDMPSSALFRDLARYDDSPAATTATTTAVGPTASFAFPSVAASTKPTTMAGGVAGAGGQGEFDLLTGVGGLGGLGGGASKGVSTPTLLLAGRGTRALSPDTASLLSRVYGAGGDSSGASGGAAMTADAAAPVAPLASQASAAPAPAAVAAAVPAAAYVPSSYKSVATAAVPAAPAAPAAAAAASTSNATALQPSVRVVTDAEYTAVPSFLRAQLPLAQLNTALRALPALLAAGCGSTQELTVTLDTLQQTCGFTPQQAKVFINSLVKLGRATMQGGGVHFAIRLQ